MMRPSSAARWSLLAVPALLAAVPPLVDGTSFWDPYDCTEDDTAWEYEWSADQRTWCCVAKSVGCIPRKPWDCDTGYQDWEVNWSYPQKEYCCRHRARGCPQQAAAEAAHAAPTPANRTACVICGAWVDTRGDRLDISERSILWPTKRHSVAVTRMASDGLTMEFAGRLYSARYVNQTLVWDGSHVWKRAAQAQRSEEEAHKADDARGRVRVVLSRVDRNSDGHLNYTELTELQQVAHAPGRFEQSTYERLCTQFGEEPAVGLGIETLTSIYARTGALAAGAASRKFLAYAPPALADISGATGAGGAAGSTWWWLVPPALAAVVGVGALALRAAATWQRTAAQESKGEAEEVATCRDSPRNDGRTPLVGSAAP